MSKYFRVLRTSYEANPHKIIGVHVGSTNINPLGKQRIPFSEGEIFQLVEERGISHSVIKLNGKKGRLFTTVSHLINKGIIEVVEIREERGG